MSKLVDISCSSFGLNSQGDTTVVTNKRGFLEFPEPVYLSEGMSVFFIESSTTGRLETTQEAAASLNTTTQMTIECWLKIANEQGTHTIITRDSGASAFDIYSVSYVYNLSQEFIRFAVRDDSVFTGDADVYITEFNLGETDLTTTLTDSQWHHIALRVYQTGSMLCQDILIDGTETSASLNTLNSAPFSFNVDSRLPRLRVGLTNALSTNPLNNANIDDLRIWGTKVEYSEIIANMNSKLAGDETGLKGYWTFDRSTFDGTKFKDLTNQGADLTLAGSTASSSLDIPS